MKNIKGILILLVIFVSVGYFVFKTKEETVDTPITTTPQFEKQEQKLDNNIKSPTNTSSDTLNDRYVAYSPEIYENTANTRRVLFFYANWCPFCKDAQESFLNNINQIPEDVTVIRVNYNDSDTDKTEESLAKKYGITYQHTFVQIESEGTEITKWNGGGIEELLSNIK